MCNWSTTSWIKLHKRQKTRLVFFTCGFHTNTQIYHIQHTLKHTKYIKYFKNFTFDSFFDYLGVWLVLNVGKINDLFSLYCSKPTICIVTQLKTRALCQFLPANGTVPNNTGKKAGPSFWETRFCQKNSMTRRKCKTVIHENYTIKETHYSCTFRTFFNDSRRSSAHFAEISF